MWREIPETIIEWVWLLSSRERATSPEGDLKFSSSPLKMTTVIITEKHLNFIQICFLFPAFSLGNSEHSKVCLSSMCDHQISTHMWTNVTWLFAAAPIFFSTSGSEMQPNNGCVPLFSYQCHLATPATDVSAWCMEAVCSIYKALLTDIDMFAIFCLRRQTKLRGAFKMEISAKLKMFRKGHVIIPNLIWQKGQLKFIFKHECGFVFVKV